MLCPTPTLAISRTGGAMNSGPTGFRMVSRRIVSIAAKSCSFRVSRTLPRWRRVGPDDVRPGARCQHSVGRVASGPPDESRACQSVLDRRAITWQESIGRKRRAASKSPQTAKVTLQRRRPEFSPKYLPQRAPGLVIRRHALMLFQSGINQRQIC